MAIVGVDRQPEFPDWRVMITGGLASIYLDVLIAVLLEADPETRLADRIAAAIKTENRQMRPKV
jgi:hypothetical protein